MIIKCLLIWPKNLDLWVGGDITKSEDGSWPRADPQLEMSQGLVRAS